MTCKEPDTACSSGSRRRGVMWLSARTARWLVAVLLLAVGADGVSGVMGLTEVATRLGRPSATVREQSASSLTIDVTKKYGVTFDGVSRAVSEAASALQSGRAATVVIFFDEGTYHIDMPGSLFNVTRIAAPPGGRLVVAGAGMDLTTLNLTTHGNDVIHSPTGTERLTVRDLTFVRPRLTTTQGKLVAADESGLTVRVQDGFPELSDLLVDRVPRLLPEQGLFVRRFRAGFPDGPRMVTNATCTQPDGNISLCPWPPVVNNQVHFSCGGNGAACPDIQRVGEGTWRLKVATWPDGELERYRADIGRDDALIGVKIKHGGQAFQVRNCHDVAFVGVRWLGHSRGILFNCSDVVLRDTRVERDPALAGVQAMATPGGGPQVNTCNNLTVFNHTAVGTGDDSLGLFHIAAGSVSGCRIRDSFARGILLCNVSDAFAANVVDNTVVRCPVYRPPSSVHVNTC